MAAPVIQVLESGDRNHAIKVVGVADTVGGTIVDVSALAVDSQNRAVTSVRLDKIDWKTDATVAVAWDATVDLVIVNLPPGQQETDYQPYGGLNNNSGAGKTGDVLIPAPAGASNYTMTLWFRKKYG